MKNFTKLVRIGSLVFGLMIGMQAQAQVNDHSSRMIATIYANAQVKYSEATATRSSGVRTGFELQRAYIGYQHALSKQWVGRVLFDVTNDSTLKGSHYNVYVKNAYACYTQPKWQVVFGMIPTDLYSDAESHWGKRYMSLNINDLAGFGSSADLGVGFYYKWSDEWGIHAQLLNGEGYRKMQLDSSFKASLSLNFHPSKIVMLRLYGDVMQSDAATQFTTNVLLGYTHPKFRFGLEGGLQFNQRGQKGYDMAIASLWGTYNCSEKVAFFLRGDWQKPTVDGQSDDVPNSWRDKKMRYHAIVGADIVAFHLKGMQQVRLSPNVKWSQTYAGHNQVVAYLSVGAFF
ncbi:MAG: hypothetical protein Q4A44_01255 [Bacteroidales bacterium]|nr:hypothetical protein [Bacteroidales bacterium]